MLSGTMKRACVGGRRLLRRSVIVKFGLDCVSITTLITAVIAGSKASV